MDNSQLNRRGFFTRSAPTPPPQIDAGDDFSLAPPKKKRESELNKNFERLLQFELDREIAIPKWYREFKFHHDREFKFDFAWPDQPRESRLGIELDGGIYAGSGQGHQRPGMYEQDQEKTAHAILMGYRVQRFTTRQVQTGEATIFVKQFFGLLPAGSYENYLLMSKRCKQR